MSRPVSKSLKRQRLAKQQSLKRDREEEEKEEKEEIKQAKKKEEKRKNREEKAFKRRRIIEKKKRAYYKKINQTIGRIERRGRGRRGKRRGKGSTQINTDQHRST